MSDQLSDVKGILDNSKHRKVKVAIVDIDGIVRGKYIHIDKFLSAIKSGFGFCNVVFGWDSSDACYDNSQYAGWHTGYPDAEVRLDLSSFRLIPWEDDIPFCLGQFVDKNEKPLAFCPRQLLKRISEKAERMGFHTEFGVEYEWFNFLENPLSLQEKNFQKMTNLSPGMFGYSALRSSYYSSYFHDLMDLLEKFQIPIEGLHTETGPGVYEAAIAHCNITEQGDRAVLFKTAVKEIAYRHNIVPTFMARWNSQLPGCSGHIHQSLWDESRNLFYDSKDAFSMSALYKSYLAGQLRLLPAVLAFYAPTVNSYKRLVEGFWAPTRSNWGVDNRTVAHRVIPGSDKSCRLETRVGGADMNPYLSLSAALACGLYGIEKGLKLEEAPITGNGYASPTGTKLSTHLLEAAESLLASDTAKDLFGEDFVEHFANSRIWEWRQAQESVTDWELKRYFEII